MKEDTKDDYMVFIDALTDALGRSNEQSIDEVKKDLRDEGMDVEKTIKNLMIMVKQTSMAARRIQLDVAREKRSKMESEKPILTNKFSDWTKEKILSKIKEIASSIGTDVSVAYRNLDSKNIEDLKSLLEDMELVKQQYERQKDRKEK